ncbi:MAG: hypothetical protein II670_01070 [Alphaproteobacteria bacterium]|nr:hypothetical protein [Alphaproteobacteria bacterium]
MNLKKLCVLSVFCAQGFASVSDELVKPIFADKLMCEIQIDNTKELAQFAVELSSKINSAYKIYGKAAQNLKNDSDEISLSIIDTKDAFKPDRDFALKTIPTVIANCVLRQGKFHPDKIVNGLVVVFPNTGEELLKQEHWDLVILCNYVYSILYGKLDDSGDKTLFERGGGVLDTIGKNVKTQYGNEYKELIDKAVYTIGEYDNFLQLTPFLYDIELSDAVQEPYLKIKKLPYINTINFTKTNNNAYPYFIFSPVCKNGDLIEEHPANYPVYAHSKFMQPIGCMSAKMTKKYKLIASLETFTINEYLERKNGHSWTYQGMTEQPSIQVTTSNAPIKPVDTGKIELEELDKLDILELTPELYKKTSLVSTQWKFDKSKNVYKLIDLHFNKALLEHNFFPPDGYSNFLLRFPEKYNDRPVIIDDTLNDLIINGSISSRYYRYFEKFSMQFVVISDNKYIKVNTLCHPRTIKNMEWAYVNARAKKGIWKEYFLQ